MTFAVDSSAMPYPSTSMPFTSYSPGKEMVSGEPSTASAAAAVRNTRSAFSRLPAGSNNSEVSPLCRRKQPSPRFVITISPYYNRYPAGGLIRRYLKRIPGIAASGSNVATVIATVIDRGRGNRQAGLDRPERVIQRPRGPLDAFLVSVRNMPGNRKDREEA